MIDGAFTLFVVFLVGALLGLIFGYRLGVEKERPLARPTRAPRCMECGAYHESYGECPFVAAGAQRIQ